MNISTTEDVPPHQQKSQLVLATGRGESEDLAFELAMQRLKDKAQELQATSVLGVEVGFHPMVRTWVCTLVGTVFTDEGNSLESR